MHRLLLPQSQRLLVLIGTLTVGEVGFIFIQSWCLLLNGTVFYGSHCIIHLSRNGTLESFFEQYKILLETLML